MKNTMYVILLIVVLLGLTIILVLRLPVFGGVPAGKRLERIKSLANYKEGALQNLSPTPMKPDGVSYWDMIRGMIKGNENSSPKKPLPHKVPDFSGSGQTKLIWFGHSSYFLQIDGVKILVDPVFSKKPSPFSFLGSSAYKGTDFIKAEDFPETDIILITHDHYDHLDYQSILKLKDKTSLFITSLGAGAHLERWGVPAAKIRELVWGEETLARGLKFRAAPARHFTGRTFTRNQTLWSAFVLEGTKHKLYLGGDSGYDTHFKEAGEKYGPFDLAILECGQYNTYWPLIHMFPEQTVQAAKDLNAKVLMPVHWAKFSLAMHAWNEPAIRVVKKAKAENFKLTTPLLGESVILDESYPSKEWWLD
ncbi:L-ascorbate metabolism protein UlaG (beta-lactamase superfamily) [Pedobacter sp. AK017]|uniref:MBL fold metallo-hydrolase n=1 Tax=Pedobacter sp. AK017 TaxID=2723073 RepID=UPI0016132281|nr:MBL fold metallo-hydrolase [Pedobacter sp. AK017]MBB5440385.1 L-ascorbate metabolism protein UlaG (beta-lactamase superfamily) [Pedobacter sp. AK017]